MIAVTLQDLQQLITNAVDAGIQSYVKERNPKGDRVNKSTAQRYLKRQGLSGSLLDKWEDAGLISSYRTSDSRNASRYYSLADIKKLLTTVRLKETCNASMIYQITKQ